MGDLSEEELNSIERSLGGPGLVATSKSETCRMVTELRRHRAARTAGTERVREVVRGVAIALLTERKLYIVRPQQPTMNEIVLEAYGHGRACEAVALLGDDLQAVLADLAGRVAAQLTPLDCRSSPSKADILATIKRVHSERTANQWFGSDAMQDAIADAISDQLTAANEGDRPPGVTP